MDKYKIKLKPPRRGYWSLRGIIYRNLILFKFPVKKIYEDPRDHDKNYTKCMNVLYLRCIKWIDKQEEEIRVARSVREFNDLPTESKEMAAKLTSK